MILINLNDIITYRDLWEKYPEMKYELLKLREQKMFALKMLVIFSLLSGFGIGLIIGVNYG